MRITNILILLISYSTMAQDLPRRASWNASFKKLEGDIGVMITSLEIDGSLHKAGFETGDIIIKVNDRLIYSSESWTSATYGLRAENKTNILFKRGVKVISKSIRFRPLPFEEHEGINTYYEHITNDYGIRQRVLITKPKNIQGKQPAIFLIQGLSCSSIENYGALQHNWARQINDIVEKSGMVVMRVEKPGVGDSEGDCAKTDFKTELEGYRAAIRLLKQKPYVDSTKIVVYGSSMGSALAPLIANEYNLSGVISDGTFFKTWFEHMLEIERRIRKMSGDNESTIRQKMNQGYIPLYFGMLIEKKSYSKIIDENPSITEFNYHSPNHMYGRPLEYYQQLQDYDLAKEWENLKAPIRILYGTNDWIMSKSDNYMIIDMLDNVGHQDHQLHLYPGLDHWNTIHISPKDSFQGKPGKWDPKVPELIISWAKEMVEKE
ncbi:MAG: alpha/beta hydrolase [Reichenbachiella sp.]